jgi:hypothetical protein
LAVTPDAVHLIEVIETRGGTIRVDGDRLGVRPRTIVDADLLAALRQHKNELLKVLGRRGEGLSIPSRNTATAQHPETLTPEQRCGRVAPRDDDFDLVSCTDCAARVWRPRHPTMGTPVRCFGCEQREAKTLVALAAGGPRRD